MHPLFTTSDNDANMVVEFIILAPHRQSGPRRVDALGRHQGEAASRWRYDMRTVTFVIVAASLCVVSTETFPFDAAERKVIAACEEAIQQRLISPRSYQRTKAINISRPMYRGEYLTDVLAKIEGGEFNDHAKEKMKDFDENRVMPMVISYTISFDASNYYGTPIRMTAKCSCHSLDGTDAGADTRALAVEILDTR